MQVDVDSMGIAVHGLYLKGTSNSGPGLDILCVHGSLWNEKASAWRKRDPPWRRAWTQRDNPSVCWPVDWLLQDLGDSIRVLSVSYDDAALRIKGIPKQEIANVIAHELCENLFGRYNQTSCHFIIRNLSGCSSDPVELSNVCACLSLSIYPQQKLFFCVAQGQLESRLSESCCADRA
jgi:hypothetical protein